MAHASLRSLEALRATALRLQQAAASGTYQWGHMGACNCGHLAQTITHLSAEDIHRRAVERVGDWHEQVVEYCPTSGLPIDEIIRQMLDLGFTPSDLGHLERLSDPEVLSRFALEERALQRNNPHHVVRYMHAWADLLAERLQARAERAAIVSRAA